MIVALFCTLSIPGFFLFFGYNIEGLYKKCFPLLYPFIFTHRVTVRNVSLNLLPLL